MPQKYHSSDLLNFLCST